jgi:hypothetical protein
MTKHDSLSVATLPGTARQGKCAPHASAVRVSYQEVKILRYAQNDIAQDAVKIISKNADEPARVQAQAAFHDE